MFGRMRQLRARNQFLDARIIALENELQTERKRVEQYKTDLVNSTKVVMQLNRERRAVAESLQTTLKLLTQAGRPDVATQEKTT